MHFQSVIFLSLSYCSNRRKFFARSENSQHSRVESREKRHVRASRPTAASFRSDRVQHAASTSYQCLPQWWRHWAHRIPTSRAGALFKRPSNFRILHITNCQKQNPTSLLKFFNHNFLADFSRTTRAKTGFNMSITSFPFTLLGPGLFSTIQTAFWWSPQLTPTRLTRSINKTEHGFERYLFCWAWSLCPTPQWSSVHQNNSRLRQLILLTLAVPLQRPVPLLHSPQSGSPF